MLVSIFLMFKCLTRGCQCERWGWWRSKNGPGKSSFIFLLHFYNIHRSRISPSVQEKERRNISVLIFLKYISTYLPGLGCDVPKMSREKEDPVPQTNTGSLAVCLKIFKISLEKEAKSNLHNLVNIRSSTCPRSSWVHSPSSMLSTKSRPSCQMKISHQAKNYN